MHRIENEFLRIQAREYGAELTSLFNKKTGTEHLWQADVNHWAWHAPMLFPIVGRTTADQLLIKGKTYPMQKHGFARKSTFELLELSGHKMVFVLRSNDETLRQYPYRFELLSAYTLHGNRLTHSFEIINRGDDNMYFQLGGHPAFAVPFYANENYTDYYLQFEKSEHALRYYINNDGFFDGRTQLTLDHTSTLPLQPDMFADDAIIFKQLQSKIVSIRSKNHSHFLQVDFHDFEYLGLWAKVNAPYICIEPWIGCASSVAEDGNLLTKEKVVTLPSGQSFLRQFSISVFS